MKSFTTSARERESALDGAEPLPFELDGVEMTLHPPTAGQLAVILNAQSSGSPTQQIGAVIDFCNAILDDQGARHFRQRLLDGDDPFDVEDVQDIIEWAMDEWSARPTQSSSDSSSSQESTGRSSTGKQRSKA